MEVYLKEATIFLLFDNTTSSFISTGFEKCLPAPLAMPLVLTTI